MRLTGFEYEHQQKGYFINGHEKQGTIEYQQWSFVQCYLNYEQKIFQWIQLLLEEAECLEKNGMIQENTGYHYKDLTTGVNMVEYNVDICELFQERMNQETQFSGTVSVRKGEQVHLLIILGHDKCIFKQYSLTKKAWIGPNGEAAIIPKDEVLGIRISTFTSREFRFGMELSGEQLARVNGFHEGKKYTDEQVATTK